MLRINSHIRHVSLLQTSVGWQGKKKEGFDVAPLGFLDKNVKSETLPCLSGESGWSKKMTLSSHLSFTKWGELLLSTHALPPSPHRNTHTRTETHTRTQETRRIPLEARTVCKGINQNHAKS